ncbi:MAG: hypothetical protein A3J72_02695 [Nitrospirae bacterium RIFCSPHIGHO2_02_FULL_40_19]|nr:MAG: hypothetical protein A3J72_02695 [Nitrospirae bacterium RIFCSPHIGHO2_02_FULL_40_19]
MEIYLGGRACKALEPFKPCYVPRTEGEGKPECNVPDQREGLAQSFDFFQQVQEARAKLNSLLSFNP